MISRVWPDELNYVWAKNALKGQDEKPELLAQHTWSVLERLSEATYLRRN